MSCNKAMGDNDMNTSTLKAIIAVCALSLSVQANAKPVDTSVTLDSGTIKGASEGGVLSWKGIPFAAPPVGALRWRAPQPPAHWQGVRDTTAYAHDCMQKPFIGDAAPLGTPPSEDCLYANVWRPASAARQLPVIVWIYGGGFVNGGSSPPTYSGAPLARKGVVFVSFNYRLGRFGSFIIPQLAQESSDAGNYGYMDQIAALKWVKRNVAKFGGDPGNVTIVGESAGGMSVNTLLTSPMTSGLFARAVIMSGGDGAAITPGSGDAGRVDTQNKSVAFAQKLGIGADDPGALAKLRALPAETILDDLSLIQLFKSPQTVPHPYADGKVAVATGPAYAVGAFRKVPVMIGATSEDIGGKDGMMIAGARRTASVIAGHGVPVYAYRFSYVAESQKATGAGHASDIPFFFDTQDVKYGDKTTTRDNGMGDTISSYLVNFSRTGDPNGGTLKHWPRYDPAKDEIMDFAGNGLAEPKRDPWGAQSRP